MKKEIDMYKSTFLISHLIPISFNERKLRPSKMNTFCLLLKKIVFTNVSDTLEDGVPFLLDFRQQQFLQ